MEIEVERRVTLRSFIPEPGFGVRDAILDLERLSRRAFFFSNSVMFSSSAPRDELRSRLRPARDAERDRDSRMLVIASLACSLSNPRPRRWDLRSSKVCCGREKYE